MKRGDLVTVVLPGDYGKPRPAIVVQSDKFTYLGSATVLPLTSEVIDDADEIRVAILPTPENGLREVSRVMVDKISTLRRSRIGSVIGRVSSTNLADIDRSLAVFLGFA